MKKKTKPTSVRLESDFEQDLKEKCKGLGCSKSEYLQEAGKFALYGNSEFDFGDDENEESKELNKKSPQIVVIDLNEKKELIPKAEIV